MMEDKILTKYRTFADTTENHKKWYSEDYVNELQRKINVAKKALSLMAGLGCTTELKTKYQVWDLCITKKCEECCERIASQALKELDGE